MTIMPSTNNRDAPSLFKDSDVHMRKPKVAFLGPLGTYSHQAAFNRFGNDVEYVVKESIADTLFAVPSEASIAVIPAENSIFGPVIETLDLLRLSEVGRGKLLAGEITFEIQHCLLAARGTQLEDIKNVLSHEQALGQCSNFLMSQLPDTVVTKTSSTAAAAEAILIDDNRHDCAAICSEVCTAVYPELVVLEKSIQNESNNFTKFWIITDSTTPLIPGLTSSDMHIALLRVSSNYDQSPNLSTLVSQLKLEVRTIDRRPSNQEIPFHDVYFLRVSHSQDIRVEKRDSLIEEVSFALDRIRTLGWSACVLGFW